MLHLRYTTTLLFSTPLLPSILPFSLSLHFTHTLSPLRFISRELLDVEVLSQVLLMSRAVLLQDPCQLASQLLGRLAQIVSQDKPVAPGTHTKFSPIYCNVVP